MRQYNKSLTSTEFNQLNMQKNDLLSAIRGSNNHLDSSTQLMMGTHNKSITDSTPR